MDINGAVCKLPIMSSISNFSDDSDSFARNVYKAPKRIGTITVFTLNCFLASAAKSMYLSIFSSSFFFNMMIHWDCKIHDVPHVLLPINHYHIWPVITEFSINLYCFVPVDCYFAINSLLQHWVHGCTIHFLQGSHTSWVRANEWACQLYHFEFDILS